jgi:hypothetical protein
MARPELLPPPLLQAREDRKSAAPAMPRREFMRNPLVAAKGAEY